MIRAVFEFDERSLEPVTEARTSVVCRDPKTGIERTVWVPLPEYTDCDICDQRPGTHEIAFGGVRCDECRASQGERDAQI